MKEQRRDFSMKRKHWIILTLVAVILIGVFVVVDTFYFPMINGTVDTGNLEITDVVITDKEITLTLGRSTSACFATHIKPKYKDGTLYIIYKGGLFVGGLVDLFEQKIITISNKYGVIDMVCEID